MPLSSLPCSTPPGQLPLNPLPGLPVHNGLVVVPQEDLLLLSPVLHLPAGEIVHCDIFLLEQISGVLLVAEDMENGVLRPALRPWRHNSRLVQLPGNDMDAR